MAVSTQDVLRWLSALQKVFAENRQQLTDLDSAVGDGDFGISLDRGFTAVQAELTTNPPADIRAVFQNVATVLIKTMGGSSGPLLGTFFLRAGTASASKSALDPVDVVAYVRRVERLIIEVCAELGLPSATRIIKPGYSGVWVPADERGPARKVGAIGIRVARGVTLHGFALNCDCDLSAYGTIVPCGITDAGVTSISAELGRPVTVADAMPVVRRHLATLG